MTSIFEQVKAALAPRLPEVLAKLLPGGRVSGREYVCASLQGGVGTSCATNLESGKGTTLPRAKAGAMSSRWPPKSGVCARERLPRNLYGCTT